MVNETKQTAVELFIQKLEEKAIEETEGLNQIYIVIDVNEYLALKQQAKEMEKEQMIQAWKKGDGQFDKVSDKMSLEYYKKEYGGKK